MDDTQYTEDSIETLDPREHVRLRRGMYIGDTSTPNQLLIEIFSNALDEHNIGHGDKIQVDIHDDGTVEVEDWGQGFPVGVERDDGKTVLEAAFSVLNTSGKFRDDGVYGGNSLGLNGQGGKLANFLSSFFEVITIQDSKMEHLHFRDGILTESKVVKNVSSKKSGTYIQYRPDPQFFGTGLTDVKFFKSFFEDMTCLCPDLTIVFNGETVESSGMEDFLNRHITSNIEISSERFYLRASEDDFSVDLGLTFTDSAASSIYAYVNYGYTDTGPHISTIKSCLTRVLNQWARDNGILKDKEKNLDGASIQEGLVLVANIVAPKVEYNAQVKTTVTKIDTSFLSTSLGEHLQAWLDNHIDSAKAIVEKAVIAKRAAEAARKARAAVKAKKKPKSKVRILNPEKLKDAEKLGQDSILLCVEGNSAAASIAVSRDTSKFGILALRGKMINGLSNTDKKLAANEEVQLLLKALGIDSKEYDPDDLRYGKVAICSDADSDGSHIGLLVMTVLQHYCPQFIQEGRLGWLRSPLYILKNGNNETYFFTDKERAEAGELEGELQRNKGLGSLSPQQARDSMFGENQHMDILMPQDDSIEMLYALMGPDNAPRKDYIFKHIDFAEVRE